MLKLTKSFVNQLQLKQIVEVFMDKENSFNSSNTEHNKEDQTKNRQNDNDHDESDYY